MSVINTIIGTAHSRIKSCFFHFCSSLLFLPFIFLFFSQAIYAVPDIPGARGDWTMTGSMSLYTLLYNSSKSAQDPDKFFARGIDEILPRDANGDGTVSIDEEISTGKINDRAVTAVASDMLVQFYGSGTDPIYTYGDDLVVWRTDGVDAIPPGELMPGKTDSDHARLFKVMKRVVRDSIFMNANDVCAKWRDRWWLEDGPNVDEKKLQSFGSDYMCIMTVRNIVDAFRREREMENLREDLQSIAYGDSRIFDGISHSRDRSDRVMSGSTASLSAGSLRTYDLIRDISLVSSKFGSGALRRLLASAGGEQCDDGNLKNGDGCDGNCILENPDACGDGVLLPGEQCDDGNKNNGDGCDEFCQVEGNYCGDGETQDWELCDEGKECPDGSLCFQGSDCIYEIPGKNGEYSAPGSCKIGDIFQNVDCLEPSDCLGLSKCLLDDRNTDYSWDDIHYCSNSPYFISCTYDEDCTSCTNEYITGECYTTGKLCKSNAECPSKYCVLDTSDICRPRTYGGVNNKSFCNKNCEARPSCGDGIVYLDKNGAIEECDPGMHCSNGDSCLSDGDCKDGKSCEARSTPFCSDSCQIINPFNPKNNNSGDQDDAANATRCGDGIVQDGEECDDGGICENGEKCTASYDCLPYMHCSGYGYRSCESDIDCPRDSECVPGNSDTACVPMPYDGCNDACQKEFCGDDIVQPELGEECDDGMQCYTNALLQGFLHGKQCKSDDDCPNYYDGVDYLEGDFYNCITRDKDGCSAKCLIEKCGNGRIDGNEECDDGNAIDDDWCSNSCVRKPNTPPAFCPEKGRCGDGCINAGEECDDKNEAEADGCYNCQLESCGNGLLDFLEQCDDGMYCEHDGSKCSPDDKGACNLGYGTCAYYGSVLDDEGNFIQCHGDDSNCPIGECDAEGYRCVYQGGEYCTDGADCGPGTCDFIHSNCVSDSCDGCTDRCSPVVCGDGFKDCSEECDDGNDMNGDGCNAMCQLEFCGDGVLDLNGADNMRGTADDEQCDMGWNNSDTVPGACRTDCTLPRCGDAVVDPGEECDVPTCTNGMPCIKDADCVRTGSRGEDERCAPRGNNDVCTADCRLKPEEDTSADAKNSGGFDSIDLCGDGYRDTGEQCDDGNKESGDGCSADCKLENVDLCGNGRLDPGEECDQGNPYDSVECTAFCQFPHPAPFCGDGRKDFQNVKYESLSDILEFREGYRLDFRFPDGKQISYPGLYGVNILQDDAPDGVRGVASDLSYGGWYVTPRVFRPRGTRVGRIAGANDDLLSVDKPASAGHPQCPKCGNRVKDPGEECDNGRLTEGYYSVDRAPYAKRIRSRYYPWILRSRYYPWIPLGVVPRNYYTFTTTYGPMPYGAFWANHIMNYWLNFFFLDPNLNAAVSRQYRADTCSEDCTLTYCGNDKIDPGETCDDNNLLPNGEPQDGDGCSKECFLEGGFSPDFKTIQWPMGNASPKCGDDVISKGEQCDDGGKCVTGSGTTLQGSYCRLEPGREFCDTDGEDDVAGTDDDQHCAPVNGDGCSDRCMVESNSLCGNGILEPYEQCDPTGTCGPLPESCSTDDDCPGESYCVEGWNFKDKSFYKRCSPIKCETDLSCPDGLECEPWDGSGCSKYCVSRGPGDCADLSEFSFLYTGCVPDLCGNGKLDPEEQCDDGNEAPGDGCSQFCTKENVCGNSDLDPGEQCDDGNVFDDDGCSSSCLFEYCGDGVIQPGLGEECDAGGENGYSQYASCSPTCRLPSCGDGITQKNAVISLWDGEKWMDEFPYSEVCDPGTRCENDPDRYCSDDLQCPRSVCDYETGACTGDWSKKCSSNLDCQKNVCKVMDESEPGADGVLCKADCTESLADGAVYDPMLCGNGITDAGEQCDDGNKESGDGCSVYCRFDTTMPHEARLDLCQDGIGDSQVSKWKEALLMPSNNPFVRNSVWTSDQLRKWMVTPGNTLYGLWRGGWWDSCGGTNINNSFAGSMSSLLRCAEKIVTIKHTPDRQPILPYQPVGIASFPACQEPRSEIASTVEFPNVPVIQVPEYKPWELVRDIERMVCAQSGWPRRAFTFMCSEESNSFIRSLGENTLQALIGPVFSGNSAQTRDMVFLHVLDIGYRSGERVLNDALSESFRFLSVFVKTAERLFTDMERVNFTDKACPIGGEDILCK